MQCPYQQFHDNIKAIDAETSQTQSIVLKGRPLGAALVLVFVISAVTAPIVADGSVALIPFWAIAVAESAAKPTEGGLKRKTE
jgi:hypothetical protein